MNESRERGIRGHYGIDNISSTSSIGKDNFFTPEHISLRTLISK